MDGRPPLIPTRWPGGWRDPALMALLERTPINCIVLDAEAALDPGLKPVLDRARRAGLKLYLANGTIQFTSRSNPRWDLPSRGRRPWPA